MDENDCSRRIIGAAIEVHRALGPGMLESVYQHALSHELRLQGMCVDTEVQASVRYKDLQIPGAFRLDLLVEGLVIVELKSVDTLLPTHEAQLLTYLRCCNLKLGLLLNSNEPLLKRGIVRIVNGL